MRKAICFLFFLLVLAEGLTAQLQTLESKRNFWTGTRYYMGGERLRVPEVQLHLDNNAPEAGKAFQRGKAPFIVGNLLLGTAAAAATYNLVSINRLDNKTRNTLTWVPLGLSIASFVFIETGIKRRQKALDIYNGMARQR